MKRQLIRINWLLGNQLGISPILTLRFLTRLPRFARDLLQFRSTYAGSMTLQPCLHDWSEEGGATRSEYFWQDLIVARNIFKNSPTRHVDVGSRVDGFVAHVASFREVEVFDVRPTSVELPGVKFVQADLMQPLVAMEDYCDSLSCLHALEHFGLGRYGDPVDPRGFERGFSNMAKLLKARGVFYLSVPVGRERVEFNANRVFDPRTILSLARENSLTLASLILISQAGEVRTPTPSPNVFEDLATQVYSLAIFTFEKLSAVPATQ